MKGNELITIGDFSKEATRKAVLNTSLQKSVTLYPAAIGIIGALTMALLDVSLITFLMTAGGLGIGIGSWVVNYCVRGNFLEAQHIQKLHKALVLERERALKNLERELGECCGANEGEVKNYARQAQEQFRMAQGKLETLLSLLKDKLSENELTAIRYSGTAEQVYLSILDNLRKIAGLIKSANAIGEGYIDERLKELERLKNPAEADQKEMATISERRKLRESQLEKINNLLTSVEEALTQIDKTTAVIADMKALKGEASVDLETAKEELGNLIKSAHKYAHS